MSGWLWEAVAEWQVILPKITRSSLHKRKRRLISRAAKAFKTDKSQAQNARFIYSCAAGVQSRAALRLHVVAHTQALPRVQTVNRQDANAWNKQGIHEEVRHIENLSRRLNTPRQIRSATPSRQTIRLQNGPQKERDKWLVIWRNSRNLMIMEI